jgi:hypothetical protein
LRLYDNPQADEAAVRILYGAFWFKEKRIGERLAGGVIMLAGIVMIGRQG